MRRLVDQRGVAIDAREIDGIVRRGGRQLLVRRKLLVRPVVLIPASSLDPLAGPRACRAGAHHLDDLVVGLRPAKPQDLQAGTEAGEVAVRVLQPGHDGLAARVDDPVAGPTSFSASALEPTTTNRSPRTATASARGCVSFTV